MSEEDSSFSWIVKSWIHLQNEVPVSKGDPLLTSHILLASPGHSIRWEVKAIKFSVYGPSRPWLHMEVQSFPIMGCILFPSASEKGVSDPNYLTLIQTPTFHNIFQLQAYCSGFSTTYFLSSFFFLPNAFEHRHVLIIIKIFYL